MRRLAPVAVAVASLFAARGEATPGADKQLGDYRYFRALSIDLLGRPPTRAELAAFEATDFDLEAWLDARLAGAPYAERMRRIYTDALRLEVGPSFQFVPNPLELRRAEVTGPDGAPVFVFWRRGQRRLDPATDGDFCLTAADTGLQFPPNAAPTGTATPVTREVLDAKTVTVQPWWLWADYRARAPKDPIGDDWAQRFPGFVPVPALAFEADGKTRARSVRVCKEEAQTAETGAVYASGRAAAKKGPAPDVLPGGRLTQPPNDSAFARASAGRAVSCLSGTGFASSVDCGCGVGLERCMPAAGMQFEPPTFVMPTHAPLGLALPFEATPQPAAAWERVWWAEEARHFLERIFEDDRDFREVLTSRATEVNGPLAQFYRFMASLTCCGPGADLGYAEPIPLVDPAAMPQALSPVDTATWMRVGDRGPHASGILTMPIFLTKYGSRRARAHVLYSAFLCKDFVADTVKLEPSMEPDLTKRAGCASCHQTLEPMAAYFTRVAESDWTFLPPARIATAMPGPKQKCAVGGTCAGAVKSLYDDSFKVLRGAYAAPAHAEAGPAGLAQDLAGAPELAPCVVQTVAQALLGRALVAEDDAWKTQLVRVFVDGGYRVRALVKAIVMSPRYRAGNDTKVGSP